MGKANFGESSHAKKAMVPDAARAAVSAARGISAFTAASAVTAFASIAASWIIPHYCIICGERVEKEEGVSLPSLPLCARCGAGLTGISGPRCGVCGRELYSEREICYGCRGVERSCSEIYPLFKFRDGPAALMREYKSSKRFSLVPFWAGLLSDAIDRRWPDRTIVPVPPRPEKIRRREWDQIEAIAAALEKRGYRVERVLERKVDLQQKKLNREMRKANAGKAYSVIPSLASSMPSRIILIDDVYTTGATIEACAKALRENGAESVCALVVAAD